MKTNNYNDYFSGEIYKDWEKAPGKDVLINALKYFKKKNPKLTSILDVGCGTGYFLNRAYNEISNDFNLFGIDVSKTAIERGKNLYPFFNLECGDAHQITFQHPPQKFDCVISYGSYEHFSKPGIAIKEASRLLKNGIILTM